MDEGLRKLTADSDNKFEIYACSLTSKPKIDKLYGEALTANDLVKNNAPDPDSEATAYAVVSTSGSIVKSGTKKDGDDYKITVSGYKITKIKDSDDREWTVDGTTVKEVDDED